MQLSFLQLPESLQVPAGQDTQLGREVSAGSRRPQDLCDLRGRHAQFHFSLFFPAHCPTNMSESWSAVAKVDRIGFISKLSWFQSKKVKTAFSCKTVETFTVSWVFPVEIRSRDKGSVETQVRNTGLMPWYLLFLSQWSFRRIYC